MTDLHRPNHHGNRSDRGFGEQRVYDADEDELLAAIIEYRRVNPGVVVGMTDVLWICKRLGYRKESK
jgi:hypothetical protein